MTEFAATVFTFAFVGVAFLFGYLTDIDPRRSMWFSPLFGEPSRIGSLEVEVATAEPNQPRSVKPPDFSGISGRSAQPHTAPGSVVPV